MDDRRIIYFVKTKICQMHFSADLSDLNTIFNTCFMVCLKFTFNCMPYKYIEGTYVAVPTDIATTQDQLTHY